MVGVTYFDNGGPYKDSYACPSICAANHKHLVLKDTTVVYSNMADKGNSGFLSGLFNLIGGKQGTEIDALPVGDASLDNMKEMKRNVGGFVDNYNQAKSKANDQVRLAKMAKNTAITDMRDEGVSEEIISSVMPVSDLAFKTGSASSNTALAADPFVKAANNEWLMESAEEGLPSTEEYLKSQYNRLYDGGYANNAPSWTDFKKNLGDFAHRTSGIESDYGANLNELGGTTSAKGLYQFTDASVGTGKNRLLNMGVSQDVVDKIDDNPLNWSKDQSDMMFFGNLFPRGGSDDLFKKIAKGDKGAMKELYSKYHHTDKSHKKTQERAKKFFN